MRRVLALLILATAAPGAAAADQFVTWSDPCCTPQQIAVGVGEKVTFTGSFSVHPLVWNFADFPTRSSGASGEYVFPKAGTFPFYCQAHPGTMSGRVKVGTDLHATPDFSFSPAAPKVGETVTFTYTGTADPDGTIASYQWDLDGNGSYETTGAQPNATRAYASAGTVTVRLQVVDDGHETSAAAARDVTVTTVPQTQDPTPPPGDDGGGSETPGTSTPVEQQPTGPGDAVAPSAARPRVEGRRLRFALDEAATLAGVLRRNGQRVRRFSRELPAGAVALRLGRRLPPGRYVVRFTLTDAAGNVSRVFVVRFRRPHA